jgi:hypothetical protein
LEFAVTTCSTAVPAPLRCPTLEQSIAATAALLPRGRAWPANDLAMLPQFLAWLAGLVGAPAARDWPQGFVQTGFIAAVGAVRNYLETQLCALYLEFWCATETLTNDLWMAEYGLPDGCDPYPNLCAKVAALGGRRCELYQELCAANGWSITCEAEPACPGTAFAGGCYAGGCYVGNPAIPNQIEIIVNLNESSSYTGSAQTPALAGLMQAGMPLTCSPDITPLQCLMERIAPAHVTVDYVLN